MWIDVEWCLNPAIRGTRSTPGRATLPSLKMHLAMAGFGIDPPCSPPIHVGIQHRLPTLEKSHSHRFVWLGRSVRSHVLPPLSCTATVAIDSDHSAADLLSGSYETDLAYLCQSVHFSIDFLIKLCVHLFASCATVLSRVHFVILSPVDELLNFH